MFPFYLFCRRKLKKLIQLIFAVLLVAILAFLYSRGSYSGDNLYYYDTPKEERWLEGGYGELGRPVTDFSSKNYPNEVRDAYRTYGFNQFTSDKISLNRSLPDVRNKNCKRKPYPRRLPSVSVIIVFYDEGMSTLYRTVYSVFNRSPVELIHEIILVDDHSTLEHLKGPLDKWVSEFGSLVKVVRQTVHDGLITARLAGAAVASGDVLVFLDSHCEATVGWLPPLLAPIRDNYRRVTAPIIDIIDHDTFEYKPVNKRVRGTFSWLFYYKEKDELQRVTDPSSNVKSPVMAGGLFAISKKWWHELGEYDPDLFSWGGEQYELSFKIWMCGGEMYNVPCSHVGHVYRGPGMIRNHQGIHIRHPNSLMVNYKRVAEVWLDDYKHFLYMKHRHVATANEGNNIEARKQLRKSLQCKTFGWYLNNVVNDTLFTRYEPDFAYSLVRSTLHNDMCICNRGLNSPLALDQCSSCQQPWRYTWIGEFSEDEHCWDYHPHTEQVHNSFCHESRMNQQFYYNENDRTIRLVSSNKCVTGNIYDTKVTLSDCTDLPQNFVTLWNIQMLDNSIPPPWSKSALHPPREH